MSYRASHQTSGGGYHLQFTENRHRRCMWTLEKALLSDIIRRYSVAGSHLDFACGTGRILQHLRGSVRRSVGVDVSQSMLEIARAHATKSHFVLGDITREGLLGSDTFDIVTAFRFFPNAEPSLRLEAIHALKRHLSREGLLIFNNHLKRGSAAHCAEALIGKSRKNRMSPAEVELLLEEAGFRVLEQHYLGVLPFTERFHPLPYAFLLALERRLSRGGSLRRFAQNWIYVCTSS